MPTIPVRLPRRLLPPPHPRAAGNSRSRRCRSDECLQRSADAGWLLCVGAASVQLRRLAARRERCSAAPVHMSAAALQLCAIAGGRRAWGCIFALCPGLCLQTPGSARAAGRLARKRAAGAGRLFCFPFRSPSRTGIVGIPGLAPTGGERASWVACRRPAAEVLRGTRSAAPAVERMQQLAATSRLRPLHLSALHAAAARSPAPTSSSSSKPRTQPGR